MNYGYDFECLYHDSSILIVVYSSHHLSFHLQNVFHSNKHHPLLFSSLLHTTMVSNQYNYTKQRSFSSTSDHPMITMHKRYVQMVLLPLPDRDPVGTIGHPSPVPPYVLYQSAEYLFLENPCSAEPVLNTFLMIKIN